MRLSIIIRTWDRLEYTIRAIISIERNCGIPKEDYEIIVVDMGSEDGTRQWLFYNQFGFYRIQSVVPLTENIGDGKGMQMGIQMARGEFIAQHDNDIELDHPGYYAKLIELYEKLETSGHRVCAIGGAPVQGPSLDDAPMRFGKQRYEGNQGIKCGTHHLYQVAWVRAAFVFRQRFTEVAFGAGMCNSWCGEWFDRGYENLLDVDAKWWHIDSSPKGAEYVKRQFEKHPKYDHVKKHYSRFI